MRTTSKLRGTSLRGLSSVLLHFYYLHDNIHYHDHVNEDNNYEVTHEQVFFVLFHVDTICDVRLGFHVKSGVVFAILNGRRHRVMLQFNFHGYGAGHETKVFGRSPKLQ